MEGGWGGGGKGEGHAFEGHKRASLDYVDKAALLAVKKSQCKPRFTELLRGEKPDSFNVRETRIVTSRCCYHHNTDISAVSKRATGHGCRNVGPLCCVHGFVG